MEQEPTYHLEGIIKSKEEMEDFEGPLTLILMLLSKNKIEIRDIQISEILEQYLAYLDEMKAMDLEIASEFVQMASHLLYIKNELKIILQKSFHFFKKIGICRNVSENIFLTNSNRKFLSFFDYSRESFKVFFIGYPFLITHSVNDQKLRIKLVAHIEISLVKLQQIVKSSFIT